MPMIKKKGKLSKTQIKRNETIKRLLKDKSSFVNETDIPDDTILIKGSDLRLGHHMLAAIAKVKGHDVDNLPPGRAVGFLNNAGSRVKIFYSREAVAYIINPTGGRLDRRAVKDFSTRVSKGKKASWDQSLATVLNNQLRKNNRLAEKEDLKHT